MSRADVTLDDIGDVYRLALFAAVERNVPVDQILAELTALDRALDPEWYEFLDATFYDVEVPPEEEGPSTAAVSGRFVDIDTLAAMYRAAGLHVNILAGAHARGARMFRYGYDLRADGEPDVRILDQHHTAQSTAMSDEASIAYMTFNAPYPVLCNTYPHRDTPFTITICAAGPTYTAGRGGPWGDVPQDQGNRYGWSRECPNNGVGEPWSEQLQATIAIATAVELEFFGRGADGFVPAHFEYAPGRKIDPRGPSTWTNYTNTMWDMDRFRSDVDLLRHVLFNQPPEENLMQPSYIWNHSDIDKPGRFWYGPGGVQHVDGVMKDALELQGVPVISSDNDDVYQSALIAIGRPDGFA